MVKEYVLKADVKAKIKEDEGLMLQIAELRGGKISTVVKQLKDNHINILQYPVLQIISNQMGCSIDQLLEEVDGE